MAFRVLTVRIIDIYSPGSQGGTLGLLWPLEVSLTVPDSRDDLVSRTFDLTLEREGDKELADSDLTYFLDNIREWSLKRDIEFHPCMDT